MSALGAQMLVQPARTVESAAAKMIEKSDRDSALAALARGLERGLNEALAFHAQLMGLEIPSDAGITLNRDFSGLPMDAPMVRAISEAVGAGQLSLISMWELLARGELIDIDADLEFERIEAEGLPMPPS